MVLADVRRKVKTPKYADFITVSETGSISIKPEHVADSNGFKKQVDVLSKKSSMKSKR